MYTVIKGIYENGELTLEETPPTRQRVAVIVTFMEEQTQTQPRRRPGSLLRLGQKEGKVYRLPDDFNNQREELNP
ncbi:hypothetical protein [Methylomagnum sp.]